ncbi:hypothetical protein [Limimaricola sp. AA108-03]|uniref:hypothetical protein n=1 Tax=Limimaricola sp. AA108-03 TaxID=3425945 RepID=UPI003D774117
MDIVGKQDARPTLNLDKTMFLAASDLRVVSDSDQRASLEPKDRRLLAQMRLSALRCRSRSRIELAQACAMVGTRRDIPPETVLDALIRTLGEALGRSPRFYRPTARALSFDESWLLRLIAALRDDDLISATFLLHSRVPAQVRRSLVHLVARVASDSDTLTRLADGTDDPASPKLERIAS